MSEYQAVSALRRFGPPGILVLFPLLLIVGAVRPGQFLYGEDAIGGFYHLRGAIGKAFAEGRLPFWDPHVMAGFPLLAAMQGAVFYPPSWLCVFLPPGLFWTTSALLHLALAGLFAHRWLERGLGLSSWGALGGSFLYLMSAYAAGHLHAGHMNYIWAYPWLPALLWRLERYLAGPTLKRGVLLALVPAMLLFCGVAQILLFGGVLAAVRLLVAVLQNRDDRKARVLLSARAVGLLGLGGLLCAPQLLPTLELIGEGQRLAIRNYEFVTSYSVAPLNFATLLAPAFFGDGRTTPVWAHGSIWESMAFVGISGLALAALGAAGRHRQRFLWTAVAIAAVLLSTGRYTPVFRLFYEIVPGAGLFRAPSRYLLLFTLSAAALAGMGIDRLCSGDAALRRHSCWVAGIAGAVMLAAVGLHLSLSAERGWWPALVERERSARREEKQADPRPPAPESTAGSLAWGAWCAAATGVCLLSRRGPAAAAALGLLLAGELWVFDSRYYVGHPVEGMEWSPEFVANVRSHPRYPFRIATVTPGQTPAIGMCQLAGLDHIGGYEPMMLRRYTELANVARGKPSTDLIVAMVLARPCPLFDLLGARYWIVPGQRQEPPGWKAVGQLESGIVYENPAAFPRAFMVGRSINLPSSEDRLAYMAGRTFDARRMVVTERDSGGLPDGADGAGDVRLVSAAPGSYVLRTESAGDAFLVLSEAYYPGWSVRVDGAPAELLRADHLLQAVRLAAGGHEVRFEYQPRFLGLGFAIAAAALAIPLCLAALRFRRLDAAVP